MGSIKPGTHQSLQLPHGTQRVCIVGGGFGGLYCALALHRRLKRRDQGAHITLVEPRDRFTFTPLLYELVTNELQPWEISPSYQRLLAHTSVQLCHDWVDAIDRSQQTLTLRQGETLSYDYLVVSVGSRLRPPTVVGHQGHALPFATLEDCQRLEQRLVQLESQPGAAPIQVVVAGAGASGVELACKLADRLKQRGQVIILDRRHEILRAYPEPLRRAASQALRRRGIEVRLGAAIQRVDADQVLYHYQEQPYAQPADVVVWTVGTVPHPWLGPEPPKPSALGQCVVLPTLQLPEDQRVFVLGDMAAMPAPGRPTLPGADPYRRAPMTAQAAYQAAPIVAHNLWALMADRPLKSFSYRHLGDMLTLGKQDAVVCGFGLCLTRRIGALSRRWAYWLRLPTARHRWRVLRNWCLPH
jgi:NADH:ubiquinone reductase (non-electrogenic)